MDHTMNKKEKILNQAEIEFSNHIYEEASINRIIKDIDMARGTFYLYFKNKEELYFYMLEKLYEKGKNLIIQVALDNNKDVKKIMVKLFDLTQSGKSNKLIKNIFINFNTTHFEKLIPMKPNFGDFLQYIDFDKYNLDDSEKLVMIHLLQIILIQNISLSSKCPKNAEKIRDFMIRQIDLLLKGKERY